MPQINLMQALLLLVLASLIAASPIPSGIRQLTRRGNVSPSPFELFLNTIGFGIPAVIAFILRMINRFAVLRSFHLEDWLMCLTMFFYVSLLCLTNMAPRFNTNLYLPEQEAAILANPADVNNRIIGSKIAIALEQTMIAATWGVKLCIWGFLMRLARKIPNFQRLLKILFWYIVLGFISIEVVYYGVLCRPFSQYWAVPVQNLQCATYHDYSIVQMVFNISSDFGLIICPLPTILGSKIPHKRKVILISIFLMAGFTMLCAIMNVVYKFQSPMTTTYQLWYTREASVAVIVGNLICTWQLLQKLFRLSSFNDKHTDIFDDPDMPQLISHHFVGPINPAARIFRRAWDYFTLSAKKTDSPALECENYHSGTENSIRTNSEQKRSRPFGSRSKSHVSADESQYASSSTLPTLIVTKTVEISIDHEKRLSYMMTLARDTDDAHLAVRFRNEHNIE